MITDAPARSGLGGGLAGTWWPVALGLLALYVPTFVNVAGTLWQQEEHAHGPIVLVVALWLGWQQRRALAPDAAGTGGRGAGIVLVAFGLLCYVLGRSQDIVVLDVGSLLPVLAGTLLVAGGWPALRAFWFPLLFLVFMVPIPGVVLDALTGPLKQSVSQVAESLLYASGYPVARTGVVLSVGQYQLLVADACSGLNSMFSLTALGLLYLHVMKYPSAVRNGILLASILPIAFVANIVRVMILVLVTYHFGDEAGQGFVHGFAGMVLFVVALLLLFCLDSALGLAARLVAARRPSR